MSRILGGFWNEGGKKENTGGPEVMVHTLNCVIRAEATLQGGVGARCRGQAPNAAKARSSGTGEQLIGGARQAGAGGEVWEVSTCS